MEQNQNYNNWIDKNPDELKELSDLRKGILNLGLSCGDDNLDKYFRYNHGELSIISGIPGSGKSFYLLWYYTKMALQHGLTYCFNSSESHLSRFYRDVIQIYYGRHIEKISEKEYHNGLEWAMHTFKLIKKDKTLSIEETLDIFSNIDCSCYIIDPVNGLKTPSKNRYDSTYDLLNSIRSFCNEKKKSFYLGAHVVNEALRNKHASDHVLSGHIQPPSVSHIEQGGAFWNRADNFFVLHRYYHHPTHRKRTLLSVAKIKDQQDKGMLTNYGEAISLNYDNYALKPEGIFDIDKAEIVDDWRPQDYTNNFPEVEKTIITTPNTDFYSDEDPF